MSNRPKTPNQGANDERTAILAHLRRLLRRAERTTDSPRMILLAELIGWLQHRNERYNARTRGLGRK